LAQEYILFWGGDLNGFRKIRALPVLRGGMTYIPSDISDTIIKNMYGLGVGISTVFETLGHFLFKEGQDHPIWA
jgi:hypothetical protein